MSLILLLATMAFQPGEQADQIEYLRMSFRANSDAFAFGEFHFAYTKGNCASLSDAENGIFTKSINEDGLYVFDGKNERYDLLAEPAALAVMTQRVGKNKSSSDAWVYRMLTDGEVSLLDQLWLDEPGKFAQRSPEIHPGTKSFCSNALFQFPLALGHCDRITGNLFAELTAIKEGKGKITEPRFRGAASTGTLFVSCRTPTTEVGAHTGSIEHAAVFPSASRFTTTRRPGTRFIGSVISSTSRTRAGYPAVEFTSGRTGSSRT